MGILDKLFAKHALKNTLAIDLTRPVKSFGAATHFSRSFYKPNSTHQSTFEKVEQNFCCG